MARNLLQQQSGVMATPGTPNLIRSGTTGVGRNLLAPSATAPVQPKETVPTKTQAYTGKVEVESPLSWWQRLKLSFADNDREGQKYALSKLGYEPLETTAGELVIRRGDKVYKVDEPGLSLKDVADVAGSVPTTGGMLAGSLAGGLATTPTVAGIPAGVAAGGAAGAGIGSTIKQAIGKAIGVRRSISPGEIALETGGGALGAFGAGLGTKIVGRVLTKTVGERLAGQALTKLGIRKVASEAGTRYLTTGRSLLAPLTGRAPLSAALSGLAGRAVSEAVEGTIGGAAQAAGVSAIETRGDVPAIVRATIQGALTGMGLGAILGPLFPGTVFGRGISAGGKKKLTAPEIEKAVDKLPTQEIEGVDSALLDSAEQKILNGETLTPEEIAVTTNTYNLAISAARKQAAGAAEQITPQERGAYLRRAKQVVSDTNALATRMAIIREINPMAPSRVGVPVPQQFKNLTRIMTLQTLSPTEQAIKNKIIKRAETVKRDIVTAGGVRPYLDGTAGKVLREVEGVFGLPVYQTILRPPAVGPQAPAAPTPEAPAPRAAAPAERVPLPEEIPPTQAPGRITAPGELAVPTIPAARKAAAVPEGSDVARLVAAVENIRQNGGEVDAGFLRSGDVVINQVTKERIPIVDVSFLDDGASIALVLEGGNVVELPINTRVELAPARARTRAPTQGAATARFASIEPEEVTGRPIRTLEPEVTGTRFTPEQLEGAAREGGVAAEIDLLPIRTSNLDVRIAHNENQRGFFSTLGSLYVEGGMSDAEILKQMRKYYGAPEGVAPSNRPTDVGIFTDTEIRQMIDEYQKVRPDPKATFDERQAQKETADAQIDDWIESDLASTRLPEAGEMDVGGPAPITEVDIKQIEQISDRARAAELQATTDYGTRLAKSVLPEKVKNLNPNAKTFADGLGKNWEAYSLWRQMNELYNIPPLDKTTAAKLATIGDNIIRFSKALSVEDGKKSYSLYNLVRAMIAEAEPTPDIQGASNVVQSVADKLWKDTNIGLVMRMYFKWPKLRIRPIGGKFKAWDGDVDVTKELEAAIASKKFGMAGEIAPYPKDFKAIVLGVMDDAKIPNPDRPTVNFKTNEEFLAWRQAYLDEIQKNGMTSNAILEKMNMVPRPRVSDETLREIEELGKKWGIEGLTPAEPKRTITFRNRFLYERRKEGVYRPGTAADIADKAAKKLEIAMKRAKPLSPEAAEYALGTRTLARNLERELGPAGEAFFKASRAGAAPELSPRIIQQYQAVFGPTRAGAAARAVEPAVSSVTPKEFGAEIDPQGRMSTDAVLAEYAKDPAFKSPQHFINKINKAAREGDELAQEMVSTHTPEELQQIWRDANIPVAEGVMARPTTEAVTGQVTGAPRGMVLERPGAPRDFTQVTPATRTDVRLDINDPAVRAQLDIAFGKNPRIQAQMAPKIRTLLDATDDDAIQKSIADLERTMTELGEISPTLFAPPPPPPGGRLPSKMTLENIKPPSTFMERFYNILGIPKTAKSSADFSAPFRQGLMLISHPAAFFKAFRPMFEAAFSKEAFDRIQSEIVSNADEFAAMRRAGVDLTELGKALGKREEAIPSTLLDKVPLLGGIIKGSNRAYTVFLNKLRKDVFMDIAKARMNESKVSSPSQLSDKFLKELGGFVNAASGRGSLGKLESSSVLLNNIFWSPKLIASRLHFLNPINYIRADPLIRREMLKSLFSAAGVTSTIAMLAAAAGADVNTDSNSSDFMKIRVGKSRLDLMGGFQQYIVLMSRLASGQYVDSKGKPHILGKGYKATNRYDILRQFFENKEAPIPAFLTQLLKGKDFAGKPLHIPKAVGELFYPMFLKDIWDVAAEDPTLIPMAIPAMFGGGIQTYK